MQNINLDLDKENELVFKLSVEGTRSASVKSRFLIESDKFSLSFPAKTIARDEISVSVPPLDNVISEGEYRSSLEVIVDDKVFTPMNLNAEFKKTVNVVAEVVQRKSSRSGPSVSSVVSVNRKQVDLSETKKSPELPEPKKENAVEATPKRPPPPEKETQSLVTESKPAARKRPKQRSGSRPQKSRMSKESNRRRALESTVRELSKNEGAKLSESQIKKVVNFLNKRGSK